MSIRVRTWGEGMVQQGGGKDGMVSGSEDGAELLSRIGKFHPGPLQACVSLAGPCLSSVLQLPAVQGALGSLPCSKRCPSATFSVLNGARAPMAGGALGGRALAGTPVQFLGINRDLWGSLSPADIGPNMPQTTFGFKQADEYDDHDCDFDYDYDVRAG